MAIETKTEQTTEEPQHEYTYSLEAVSETSRANGRQASNQTKRSADGMLCALCRATKLTGRFRVCRNCYRPGESMFAPSNS